eukprot:GHVH01015000.1.p1 GENE.GHVH01015000.1~~GHVH01015000.1.p1  ORF type:complete len:250 (+),score=19.61 GHVH01015000.1:672-1421(+)
MLSKRGSIAEGWRMTNRELLLSLSAALRRLLPEIVPSFEWDGYQQKMRIRRLYHLLIIRKRIQVPNSPGWKATVKLMNLFENSMGKDLIVTKVDVCLTMDTARGCSEQDHINFREFSRGILGGQGCVCGVCSRDLDYNADTIKLACGHQYHNGCIREKLATQLGLPTEPLPSPEDLFHLEEAKCPLCKKTASMVFEQRHGSVERFATEGCWVHFAAEKLMTYIFTGLCSLCQDNKIANVSFTLSGMCQF